MEEDTDVNESSTSAAKRSKLEEEEVPSSTETNIAISHEVSCSDSNDIEMSECSNKPETSKNKDIKDTEITNKIKNFNQQSVELPSANELVDFPINNKNECNTVKNDKETVIKSEEIICAEIENHMAATVKTEFETVQEAASTTNGTLSNNEEIEEEMKEASSLNLGEQEAGPSENDTVRKPRNRSRHYRPRRISSSDSSNNNSDTELLPNRPVYISDSEDENEGQNISENEDESDVESSHISNSSIESSLDHFLESNDSDDDEAVSDEVNSIQEVLTKEKPKYRTNLLYEIMYREHGLSGPGLAYKRRPDPMTFQSGVCRSRLTIEKLRVMHNLRKHRGCVNSLHFNRSGNILCTGSDDLKIILWDWANNKVIQSFPSGHSLNVFQSKFIDVAGGINIISSARDGQVRHQILPPSGSTKNISTILFRHSGPVHKIAPNPMNPFEVLTAGEDGYVVKCDIRDKKIERLVTVKGKHNQKIDLYSIAHHPLDQEFCVCGRDRFVRVYDRRNVKTPIYSMCPEKFVADSKHLYSYVTCAVYNQTGTEILASYNDGDIYLFNNKCYLKGHFTHQYRGHLNYKTIKGVNFFGPNSEYIVSGSDCGNLFIWDKESEVIVNWQKGDRSGIVNCLEPHPSFPVLATSGLDYDTKIWCPISETAPPAMEGLEKCAKQNARRLALNKTDIFNNRTFLFFISECQRNRFRRTRLVNRPVYPGELDADPGVAQDIVISSSSENGTDLEDDDEDVGIRMPCTTQ